MSWLPVPQLSGRPPCRRRLRRGGITPRVPPSDAYFPNLDLTAHLFRIPTAEWIGFDTTVSFGPLGHGLTHSVLHDEQGPFGTVQQTLTIRPRAQK
jgi:hypothetical protein